MEVTEEVPKVEEKAAEPAKAEEPAKTEEKTEEKPEEAKKTDEASTSDAQKRGQKRKREEEPFVVTEDEPEISENYMCLDWFNSDLTLKINKENFCNAEPFHVAAWGYIFSSARATHGFVNGKIAFQVKWTGNMEVKLDDVKEPHELRVGFSTDESNLQAGESPLSYACSNTGKKANDSNFEDFATTFTKDDVVTCLIDLDSAQVSVKFAKNDEAPVEAFTFAKTQLGGKAVFPHISSRNVKFEANFGKNKDETDKEAFFPIPDGYKMAATCIDSAKKAMPRYISL